MNLDQTKAALSLHIGTPAQTNMSFGPEDTPSQGMLMSLPISEIDFFDKNPRRLHDVSSYEAIKESIRSSGITTLCQYIFTFTRSLGNVYWHRVVIPVSKSCANSWKKLAITASV